MRHLFDNCSTPLRQLFDSASTIVRLRFDSCSSRLRQLFEWASTGLRVRFGFWLYLCRLCAVTGSAQIRVGFGADCAATEKNTKNHRIRHEAGNNLLPLRCKPASVSSACTVRIGDDGHQSVTNRSPIGQFRSFFG